MIKTMTFAEVKKPLTPEEKAELEALRDIEPEPDEDCPELTDEQIAEIKAERRMEKDLGMVKLIMSRELRDKAETIGKGHPGFLSRLLENALNDPELISKSL